MSIGPFSRKLQLKNDGPKFVEVHECRSSFKMSMINKHIYIYIYDIYFLFIIYIYIYISHKYIPTYDKML